MNRKGMNRNIYIYLRFRVFSFSLNQQKRRKELLRVSKENATLAKRIIELKPETNRDSWKSGWLKNAAYMDNLSKFDSDWHVTKVL
jgi:predicted membrane protein